eukprot:7379840-Prymnesium_polylepis.1
MPRQRLHRVDTRLLRAAAVQAPDALRLRLLQRRQHRHLHGEQRDAVARHVRQHVRGVRHERQAVRRDAARRLDQHHDRAGADRQLQPTPLGLEHLPSRTGRC